MQKQYWAKGPWSQEPDQKEFTYKGFNGYILRNIFGSLGGYVEIPLDNPILSRIDIDKGGLEYENLPLEVHGGITYGNRVINKKTGIEYYVAGFDCGHWDDYIPFQSWMTNPDLPEKLRQNETLQKIIDLEEKFKYGRQEERTYKDIQFVTHEIESMIDQIIAYQENFNG